MNRRLPVTRFLLAWGIPTILILLFVGGLVLGRTHRANLEHVSREVTTSPPTTLDLDAEMGDFYRRYLLVATGLAVGLVGLLWLTGRRLDENLDQVQRRINRMGITAEPAGLDYPDSSMTHAIIAALKSLSTRWNEHLRDLTRRHAEQDALLASMVESVIALDLDGRVLSMNPAAGHLLGIDPERAMRRHYGEVARHVSLHRFITESISAREPIAREILLRQQNGDRYYRAQATILREPDRRRLGTLLVLQDVTQLRKLETIRRDFVANVSHELKTPITSIKGFAETLRESDPSQEETRHFLGIILRQANRLQSIIEDLLSLSQIELSTDHANIERSYTRLHGVLRSAIATCESVSDGSVQVLLNCPRNLEAKVNAPLLEEAVVNLVGNAMKFSNGRREVIVSASQRNDELVIEVQDFGKGIAPEHLPRLFERFYRVDKARSRKLGGTGLGLAIVKHIAIAHGGTVSVESVPSQGSTFRIHLPGAAGADGDAAEAETETARRASAVADEGSPTESSQSFE